MLRKHITIICTYMCIIPAGKERGSKRGREREDIEDVGGGVQKRERGREREEEGRGGRGGERDSEVEPII